MDTTSLEKVAKLIRFYILLMTTTAGSGHPTSSLSAVELMSMLYFKYLRYDLDNPAHLNNDRVIFSKGHASPLLYALYAAAGKLTEEDLLKYRTFESNLEGHPTPRFPYAEVATGSLGQGLSVGVGEALGMRMESERWNLNAGMKGQEIPDSKFQIPNSLPHVYVLLGDGETAEGQVWEAMQLAGHSKLSNLTAIIDVNGLGQTQATMLEDQMEVYRKRWEAFGWGAIVIDGHNFSEIDAAYEKALNYKEGPVVILARTIKGKGISFLEGKEGWHGKALTGEEYEKAMSEVGIVDKTMKGLIQKPNSSAKTVIKSDKNVLHIPEISKPEATRKTLGNALTLLGETYPDLLVIDGDVQNSEYTESFREKYPDRFIQGYIAEQNAVGMAVGLSTRGYQPWFATFGSFLTRAFDQIRMASLSGATIRLAGSHGGVSVGADGPSQMGLEDIAMMRAVNGSTVVYPADPIATYALANALMGVKGISYIRTTRDATPILYKLNETFPLGGSKTFKSQITNLNDQVTIVAAGIIVHEALSAQKQLAEKGMGVRVIDCYSIKPIDIQTLKQAARETKAIVVVEDHYPEGGLGEAVKSALADEPRVPIFHQAVYKTPRSGKSSELLHYEAFDAACIIETIESFLKTLH